MKHHSSLQRLGLLLTLLLALGARAQAQTPGVGIGTTAPDASAALDIVSSAKGLLLPRLTQAQRLAISSPATGLLVFQTTDPAGFYYNGGTPAAPGWQLLSPGDNLGNHVATQGLTGTGASIGTTVGLGIRADGGLNLGQNGVGHNLLLGYQAGQALTPDTVAGAGLFNQLVGYQSGRATTEGSANVFGGYQSGYSNTTGTGNLFQGFQSGYSNTTGEGNLFSGYHSGYSNTTGNANHFDGVRSGFANTTGEYNQYVGYNAGANSITGRYNLFVGYGSGLFNRASSRVTALGANSGPSFNTDSLTNATAVGADVALTESNTLVLGNAANVGIGTSTPSEKLQVVGTIYSSAGGFKFPDGTVQTTAAAGDNLGNHTATQNLDLGTHQLVGNGGTQGLGVSAGGGLIVGSATNYNVVVGLGSGNNLDVAGGGTLNTFVGVVAGEASTTTLGSTFVGAGAGQFTTTGVRNTFVGGVAGNKNTTGAFGTFLGTGAGLANTTGTNNTLLGFQAGTNSTTGNGLTIVGTNAGITNLTGTNNTLLGYDADVTANNLTNATAVGYNAKVSQSNSLVLGDNANVGIGNSSPAYKLDVTGTLRSQMTNGIFRTHDFGPIGGVNTALLGTWQGLGGNGPQVRFEGAGASFMDIGQNPSGAFVVEGNDVARLTVQNTGAVGIGSLGGTGTRVVTADASGTLSTSTAATTALESLLRMQKGSATVGNGGANATVQVTITFPTAFATVPTVTVTPRNESGTSYDDTFAATIRSVSTTQCVVNVRRMDNGAAWGQNLQLNWLAIP